MRADAIARTLHRRRRPDGQAGFSLVEMMIAITVLGVGLLSIAGLFPLAIHKASVGDLESRATFHAQSKIEELKRFPWVQLVNVAAADTVQAVFARNWTIQENAPVLGMKQVQVTVTWRDERGPRTVTLSSFLSDSGM
ncbi:MAG: type IV pilus modification PilV family protein [Candidatus Eiseniibacteriota bacterium]